MPTFEYVAVDRAGKQRRGSVVSESASAARHVLRQRKLHPTQLRSVSELTRARTGAGWFQGRRRHAVLEFTRQLATMVESNVQLTEALNVLSSQAQNVQLNQVVQNIRDQVMAGESFTDALREYPGWFDAIYISMVRVGEVTGNLGGTLKLLGDYMGKRQRIEAKVKSALIYPVVLIVVCILVVIVLMTFVVPKLTAIVESSGNELPALTQFVVHLSKFMTGAWWIILLGLAAGWWLFRRFVATPKGRLALDRFLLGIPIFGEMLRQSVVARFATTLAALIRSGLPMAESLQVVAEVTGNAILGQAIYAARERIMAGADVATPLRDSKVVDAPTAHMIAIGERTGELEEMLLSISSAIEETTDIRIQRMSAVLEPAIIVIMAIIVGFIVMATVLPIMQVSNILNK